MGINCRNPTVFLFYLFLLSYSVSLFSQAVNTIKQGQSIRDGETIISNGQNFELGFFSPENSTNRFVGIWYKKISVQTVVWVANRENPILDSSGVFSVGFDGNLIVSDGNGRSLWSTEFTVLNNSTAILLNSGNLILSRNEDDNDSNKALWQSFNHPTDTFLPGMKVGMKQIFTSWRTPYDPSTGNFSSGIDSTKSAQFVIWEGSKRRWRSGLWNGQVFTGVRSMKFRYLSGFTPIKNGADIYFTYTMQNSSQFLRFRIQWDGKMEELRWEEEKKEWNVYWSQNMTGCDLYNKCGDYGSCSMFDSQICSCRNGFTPKSYEEWSKGNWSSGCVRRTQLQCERDVNEVGGDGFLELERMKLPDFAQIQTQLNDRNEVNVKNECENECLKNCSCKAYAYVTGIGCMTWDRDLVDIEKFQEGGNNLYVRLAKSELGSTGRRKMSKLVIVLAVVLGAIFSSAVAYLLWRNRNKLKGLRRKGNKEIGPLDVNKSKEMLRDFSGEDVGDPEEGSGPEVLSFNTIETATNNFATTNRLGHGGFGDVYRATMPCGTQVAVKRLSRRSGQGLEEFKTEVILIAKLQHRNLVRILGCCIEEEEKMLVYEYMPNKSLDAFIFDSTKQLLLDWPKRFNIIEGIARGLLYLHRDSRLRIIHRDLKASNILLDGEMNPKISDFGMAKIFGGNQNQANTNRVVGTYGYMSPEYAMEGLFSVKSDVYSFGVLLLEIVSGKKNSYFRHTEQFPNLLGHAWHLWSEGKAMEFADPSISNSCIPFEVCRCIHVGLLCVQDSAMDRPTMSAVVLMLESESATLPRPKPPTFTIGNNSIEMDMSIEEHEIVSTNDVTVTVILGR